MKAHVLFPSYALSLSAGNEASLAARKAMSFAHELKSHCSCRISAVSLGSDFGGGIVPSALASCASEGIYLLCLECFASASGNNCSGHQMPHYFLNDFSLQAELLLMVKLIGRLGKADILISAYPPDFTKALAEKINLPVVMRKDFEICGGTILSKDGGHAQEISLPAVLCAASSALADKRSDAEESFFKNFSGLMGIKDLKAAYSKPFYMWSAEDIGINLNSFLNGHLSNSSETMDSGLAINKPLSEINLSASQKGCIAEALPPEKTAEIIYDILKSLSPKEIILGGGRGLNSEGFELLKALAGRIGCRMAATRPAAEMFMLPEGSVAGASGRPMRADLYAAFGISGAPLHICGIRSRRIIAVNTDSEASIFGISARGFACDANAVINFLIAKFANNSVKEETSISGSFGMGSKDIAGGNSSFSNCMANENNRNNYANGDMS